MFKKRNLTAFEYVYRARREYIVEYDSFWIIQKRFFYLSSPLRRNLSRGEKKLSLQKRVLCLPNKWIR